MICLKESFHSVHDLFCEKKKYSAEVILEDSMRFPPWHCWNLILIHWLFCLIHPYIWKLMERHPIKKNNDPCNGKCHVMLHKVLQVFQKIARYSSSERVATKQGNEPFIKLSLIMYIFANLTYFRFFFFFFFVIIFRGRSS